MLAVLACLVLANEPLSACETTGKLARPGFAGHAGVRQHDRSCQLAENGLFECASAVFVARARAVTSGTVRVVALSVKNMIADARHGFVAAGPAGLDVRGVVMRGTAERWRVTPVVNRFGNLPGAPESFVLE